MRKLTLKFTSVYLAVSGVSFLAVVYGAATIQKGEWFWPIVLAIYLLSVVIFLFTVDGSVRQISDINQMVKEFAGGNLSPTVFLTADNELSELNNSLHEMAENLDQYLKKAVQERDRMETILTSMVEGVLAFDPCGRLILMNKTAEDMLSISFLESAHHYFLEILRNHQIADLLKQGLADGKRQVREVKLSPENNEYYMVYVTPIIGKHKKCQGAIMVLRNVTKMRRLEQMRSDFVANVSHELRTPLTSIKGYVETLLDGALDNRETAQRFLEIMNSETDRLNRLISDLLYLSELEAGRTGVAKQDVEAGALISKVIEILKPLAEGKNVTIEFTVDSGAQNIRANPDMIEQVMINLLENAIKFSHEGGVVRVEVGMLEQGTAIRVIDYGIGIPAENLPRIFERFYRIDKARSRQFGGTGLGLSIVKHIVSRHRGQVQVESEEDRGTTFTIILPAN